MLLTLGVFLILFLSFPETNLGIAEAEKALSKTKVDSSQPMHMKLITYAISLDPDQDRWQVRIACALFGYLLMQKVLNSHGQENHFFNDRHKRSRSG